MSDTPRTDAVLLEINEGRIYEHHGSMVEHARRLELELNAALRALIRANISNERVELIDTISGLPTSTRWTAGG